MSFPTSRIYPRPRLFPANRPHNLADRRTDVSAGNLAVELGATASLAGVFDGDEYFLEITVDGELLEPRVAIGSLPYALLAGDAQRVGGRTADELLAGTGGKSRSADSDHDWAAGDFLADN